MTALDLQPHAQALGFDAVEVLHDASEVREVRLLLSRLTMLSLSLLFFSRRGPQASHRCALMSYLTTDHHMSYSCDIDPVHKLPCKASIPCCHGVLSRRKSQ